LAAVRFVALIVPAVTLPTVKLVADPLTAVRLVTPNVPVVMLPVVKFVDDRFVAVALVARNVPAVRFVELIVNALKLPRVPDAFVVQSTPPIMGTPLPHITTLVVPVA